MSRYYLMAQLPSLDGLSEESELPISEGEFLDLCGRFLSPRTAEAVAKLSLTPPREAESTGYKLIDSWNDGERCLRLALGKVRAEKMGKEFDAGELPVQMIRAAATATEAADPMEAELYLNRFRMSFLETLRPTDPFSDDAVFYFGLKLKLYSRMRKFSESVGRDVYRRIYSTVMENGNTEI